MMESRTCETVPCTWICKVTQIYLGCQGTDCGYYGIGGHGKIKHSEVTIKSQNYQLPVTFYRMKFRQIDKTLFEKYLVQCTCMSPARRSAGSQYTLFQHVTRHRIWGEEPAGAPRVDHFVELPCARLHFVSFKSRQREWNVFVLL